MSAARLQGPARLPFPGDMAALLARTATSSAHRIALGLAVAAGAGFFGTALCGCQEAPGTSYAVVLDPGFTLHQTEALTEGVADWTSKVPDLTLTVTIGECSDVHDGVICVRAVDHAAVVSIAGSNEIDCTSVHHGLFATGDTGGIGGQDGGEIWIDATIDGAEPTFKIAAEHEMGHAMGLGHNQTFDTLMFPNRNHVSWTGVTQADVDSWYSIRGRRAPWGTR